MGAVNLAVGRMMSQKDVFADFVNGTYYGGRQVLQPEALEILTTHRGSFKKAANGKTKVEEFDGDVRMRGDMGTYSIVFVDENQDLVHLAMPLRCMSYDVEEYREQWKKMHDVHQKAKDLQPGAEFLSGLKREDKFIPVVSSVLFTGKTWDGPTELYDMLDFGDEEDAEFWKQYIPNYRINLVNISEFEDPTVFRSCLQHIFSMAKYREDKKRFREYYEEHREDLENMGNIGSDALLAILGKTNLIVLDGNEKTEEGNSVCRAIDEMIEDSRIDGKYETWIELVCKKLRKEKSVEVIAEELEEKEEDIREICDLAAKFAPEYEVEKVLQAWHEKRKIEDE